MCRTVNCKNCNKTTWAGCGNHVDAVMANVSRADRCSCDRNAPKNTTPAPGGFFARLFGRS